MKIKSPCVDICKYNKDGICKGCYRSKTEITNWSHYSDDQKIRVLEVLAERRNSSGFNSVDYDYYV